MSTLKEDQLAREYSRKVEPLTFPFNPVRRLVAAATDILRQKRNAFIVGGLNADLISPTIDDGKGGEKDNPNFSAEECFKITRATAEVIVMLTCEEEFLIDCLGDVDLIDKEVGKILLSKTDTEIISQVPTVMDAIQGIGDSTAEVESSGEDVTLDPEKKNQPILTG